MLRSWTFVVSRRRYRAGAAAGTLLAVNVGALLAPIRASP
jgi:hypothetical protein